MSVWKDWKGVMVCAPFGLLGMIWGIGGTGQVFYDGIVKNAGADYSMAKHKIAAYHNAP